MNRLENYRGTLSQRATAVHVPACREFLAIKRELDPRGVWGSDFLDILTALAR